MEDLTICRRRDGWMCNRSVADYRGEVFRCALLRNTVFVKPSGREYECPFFRKREKEGENDEKRV